MAELYSIRLYYNTGFNSGNRPSSPAVLNTATYRDFPSNYLWQNKDLATTRIKGSWADVSDADYCRIGNQYYLITGISMQSGMTAEIGLQIDPIISIGGINAFTIVGGWTERAHVRSSDDTLFGNILAEPWAPSQPLVIDALERIGPDPGDNFSLVQSTVELRNIQHVAEVYETVASSPSQGQVTVPSIPPAVTPTIFRIQFNGVDKEFRYPACSFYMYTGTGIPDAINDVRSLGIDSAIVSAYLLPKGYFSGYPSDPSNPDPPAYFESYDRTATPSNNMLYRYGSASVRNNKVYAMYNAYNLLSSCSGDRMEYKAEDLFNNDDKPVFVVFADATPTGKPYIQPRTFHGARTAIFQEAVAGEVWLRLPLSYTGVSGASMIAAAGSRSVERQMVSGIESVVTNGSSAIGNLLSGNIGGAFSSAASALLSAGHTEMDIHETQIETQTQQKIVAPVIAFPQNYGAQAYLGNTFFIYRTRLSDNDMIRADNFFTQFGYAQDKRFEASDLSNRQYFNFIKTRGADLKSSSPLRLRQQAASVLDAGVRLWHVLPNAAAMTNNP